MFNNIITGRYARALIEIVSADLSVEDIYSQFSTLIDYYNNDNAFKNFAGLIFIDKKARKNVASLLCHELSLNEYFENFINLLIDNERINLLLEIFKEFCKFKDEISGIVHMTVISAQKLKDKDLMELKEIFERKLNKKIIIEEELSPDILGGFLINIDGKLYNGSFKNQLNNMFTYLKQGTFAYDN